MNWTGAVCADIDDPELFFPPNDGNPREARQICKSCPIIDRCLDYALHVKVDGIRGGTTPDQRARIRRKRGIVPSPVILSPTRPEPGCGTRNGHMKHRRAGDVPCDPCRQANADYQRAWMRTRRAS